MLQDFNQSLGNDLVRGGTAWKTNPGDSKSAVQFRLESSHRRGESGNALYISYTLNPVKAAINGFRLYLKGLDALAYDHLEFWVKGDRRKGFANAFKVEFKRPFLVLDEQRYAPRNLGLNDAVHATVHQRYALAEHFFE